ncbi:MAG: T9SS type A sorting domain-containing protein [Flavobacteriales bacterium]|nr:T9SS type A sorting domain-containing protein [Flavobacteriales bacterium]MDW8431115.1 choice-of-anchor V domain-containing protein [Flavobacteriales bacterium]
MKKKFTILALSFLSFAFWLAFRPQGISRSNGAQLTSNYTGAPGFSTCTQCHSGVVNSGPGSVAISTNIPGNLYVPGQTYQVTVTLNSGGGNQAKYGFMLAPMQGSTYRGILQATDGNCFVESGGRWIVHTSAGNAGGVPTKTFTFNWTAPTSGTGAVTFYAAGNCANGNGGDGGDQIYTGSLTVNEQPSAGLTSVQGPFISVFPNPARDFIQVSAPGHTLASYAVYELSGRCVQSGSLPALSEARLEISSLKNAVYILIVKDVWGRISAERLVKY